MYFTARETESERDRERERERERGRGSRKERLLKVIQLVSGGQVF